MVVDEQDANRDGVLHEPILARSAPARWRGRTAAGRVNVAREMGALRRIAVSRTALSHRLNPLEQRAMSQRDIVVIGASAGGLQALSTIVQALPAGFRASVLIVMHSASNGQGVLPQILERISSLPAAFAADGEVLAHARIY